MSRRWIVVVVLASVLIAGWFGFLVWPGENTQASESCSSVEEDSYPQLETAAADLLGDMGDRTTRLSECERMGRPVPTVEVSVYDWTNTDQMKVYFRSHGLTTEPGTATFRPPGAEYEVSYMTSVDSLVNQGKRYVLVRFGLPS